jgi:hypothetical protein
MKATLLILIFLVFSCNPVVDNGSSTIEFPRLPAEFTLSASHVGGVATLSWTASARALTYTVFYKPITSSNFNSASVNATSPYNLNLTPGVDFDIYISAVNEKGSKSSNIRRLYANDTPPVSTNISATFDEDAQSGVITLAYADPQNDQAETCDITSLNNVVLTEPCSCASGVCTLKVQGTANYNGSGSFNYTVTANGQTSNISTANLTIESVPDISGSLTYDSIAGTQYTRIMDFGGLTIDEAVDRVELCISEDTNNDGTATGAEVCDTQNWFDLTAVLGSSGSTSGASWADYQIRNGFNGAAFTQALQATCSTAHQYITHIRVRSSASANLSIHNGAAWRFWLPNCLINMAVWYDAIDTTTVHSDVGCSTAATNGGNVACWRDKSGNNRHVTQSSAALQPVFSLSNINSRPALTSALKVLSTTANANFLDNTPYTLVGVVSNVAPGNMTYMMGTIGTANNRGLHFGNRTASTVTIAQYGNDLDRNYTANTNTNIHMGIKTGTAANSRFYYINAALLGASTSVASPYFSGVSTPLNIGQGHTTAARMNGKIGEIIIYTQALSDANRFRLEGYLSWKWGNTASLSNGHAYKAAPP